MQQILGMLAQAKNVVREEVHSPVWTDKTLFNRNADQKVEEIEGNRDKDEALKKDHVKLLLANVIMVNSSKPILGKNWSTKLFKRRCACWGDWVGSFIQRLHNQTSNYAVH